MTKQTKSVQNECRLKNVIIVDDEGKTVEPWGDVKDVEFWEWMRDEPRFAEVIEFRPLIDAKYIDIQIVPKVISGVQEGTYEVAVFQSNSDGKVFDVAKRLADKRRVNKGDNVTLSVLGCCNIWNIQKVKNI